MKSNSILFLYIFGPVLGVLALGSAPIITNIRVAQRAGSKLVDVRYDLADADGDVQAVKLEISGDGGLTYSIPAHTFTGDVGLGITPGVDKHIVWDAGADWNGQLVSSAAARITAHDGTTPFPPSMMVYVPDGIFQMGDSFAVGNSGDERPLHNVTVGAYFMDKYEVSRELWVEVSDWAVAHGYDINASTSANYGYPLENISWYSAIKWCNARSEKEGIVASYYTDSALTAVYRSGDFDLGNGNVRWSGSGYRLPTEAEWERAARGGVHGNQFPWGNTVNSGQANYYYHFGGVSPVGYYNGNQTPSGPDMANGYELYDVSGNVSEWCWDRYESSYGDGSPLVDPRGPTSGQYRIIRGGYHYSFPAGIRCSARAYSLPSYGNGLRCVKGI